MTITETTFARRIPGPDARSLSRALTKAAIRTLRALREGFARAIERWRAHAQARRDRSALLSMPDHMLRDIGMSRQAILPPLGLSSNVRGQG